VYIERGNILKRGIPVQTPFRSQRQKFTPLQMQSLKVRGTASTTSLEELQGGELALNRIFLSGDRGLWNLVKMYTVLATKVKIANGQEKQKIFKQFKTVSDKLFREAKKKDLFDDARVSAGGLLHAIDVVQVDPTSEEGKTAVKLMQMLDKDPSNLSGPDTANSTFFNNPILQIVLAILILKLVTGRSV